MDIVKGFARLVAARSRGWAGELVGKLELLHFVSLTWHWKITVLYTSLYGILGQASLVDDPLPYWITREYWYQGGFSTKQPTQSTESPIPFPATRRRSCPGRCSTLRVGPWLPQLQFVIICGIRDSGGEAMAAAAVDEGWSSDMFRLDQLIMNIYELCFFLMINGC